MSKAEASEKPEAGEEQQERPERKKGKVGRSVALVQRLCTPNSSQLGLKAVRPDPALLAVAAAQKRQALGP
jgi:hypothetical protein